MARKYGKKNIVKVDPLAYNIGLFGLGGIGKTTLLIEMCEKLVGEDGYLHFNIGREKGVDAIQGAMSEDVPDWVTFNDIINDILDNKGTDYKDLRVVLLDTLDELEKLGEKEVIRLHNKQHKTKISSFNKAFGGFNRPRDMLSELILESIDKLKSVGVTVIIVGHVKRKTQTDPVSMIDYDVITAKCSNRLFEDIKTKLDVLGLGIIKRDVNTEVIGQNIVGKDITINNTKNEKRVITFRDDNYTIESKSRFADIINEIPFDTNEFIKAITDAIEKAFNKRPIGKTFKQAEKEQKKEFENKVKQNIEEIKKQKEFERLGDKSEIIQEIRDLFSQAEDEKKQSVIEAMKKIDCKNFDLLENEDYEVIVNILNLIKESE